MCNVQKINAGQFSRDMINNVRYTLPEKRCLYD